jgi:hypothetical protein
MRRLSPRQPAAIALDGSPNQIQCSVDQVGGPVARLRAGVDLAGELTTRLDRGALAYLVFEHDNAPVALRGVATRPKEPRAIDFVVIDGVQVAERRIAERVPLIARARLTDPARTGADPVETVTSNLSLGGAMLAWRHEAPSRSGLELELFLGPDAGPVRAAVSVARRTATHLGLRFDEIADADRIRLAGLIAERARQ